MRARNRGTLNGFTLIELLLAMGVSALIAALAWLAISSAAAASGTIQDEVQRLVEVQRALHIFQEDLAQAVARPVSVGTGRVEPVFAGGVDPRVVLELTRAGFANPQKLARSDMLRVRYVFAAGGLWRQWWTELDRSDATRAPASSLLLAGVSSLQLGFLPPPMAGGGTRPELQALLDEDLSWDAQWESTELPDGAVAPLPVAVELRLVLDNFGEVRRVVELP
jgi:general secretion pathway protein J